MVEFYEKGDNLDRASLVNKGFIIWEKTPKHDLCTCGTKPVSRSGSQSQREIRFILPAHGPRHIISCHTTLKMSIFILVLHSDELFTTSLAS